MVFTAYGGESRIKYPCRNGDTLVVQILCKLSSLPSAFGSPPLLLSTSLNSLVHQTVLEQTPSFDPISVLFIWGEYTFLRVFPGDAV